MLVDWLVYGLIIWGVATVLNKTAFKAQPASKGAAWGLTILVFLLSVAALSAAKVIRYQVISDSVGVTISPRNPLDMGGAFVFAWLLLPQSRQRRKVISGAVRYHGWTTKTLFLLASFFVQSSAVADSNSNFAPVKLPRGIELQIPKGWWLLGADHNRVIQTSVEGAMDLSGIGLPDGQETNLIAANSMPRSTYAAVRVDSTIPPSVAPSEFASISAADVRELQTEMRQNLQKLLPLQGNQLIEFFGSRIEKISGHPAIVTEYRRTGPKGPVFVQINQMFTSSQEIRINLSYRESEVALWKPVVGKIRQSIVIRRWP